MARPQYTPLSADEVAALDGLDDWRVIGSTLVALFRAGSFQGATTLAASIATAADEADHHPDLDIRYPDRVRVVLTTHDVRSITTHDVDVARRISQLAAATGAGAQPAAVQAVEVTIDCLDVDDILPFWAAVLGHHDQGDVLVDPLRLGPTVWFQVMDEPRTGRNRFHLDIRVPHDHVAARLAAALEAGGRIVTDRFAPAWWVLADADGNEACLCTWQGRG